jgi:rhodanese-related sulfurtransferase
MSVLEITPQELAERLRQGPVELIDVRTPAEFRAFHLAQARNVPLDRLDPAALIAAQRPGEPLYAVCHSGTRGRQACEKLLAAGLTDVWNVAGGTVACQQAGLPVVCGRKAVSLERQVRIAAGSLVLLGIVLSWLVHPAFLALSAFVGAGLVFAGITDTCGMVFLLARMPWNRCSEAPATQPPASPKCP